MSSLFWNPLLCTLEMIIFCPFYDLCPRFDQPLTDCNFCIWTPFLSIQIALDLEFWELLIWCWLLEFWRYFNFDESIPRIKPPHWGAFGPPKVWITQKEGEGIVPSLYQSPYIFPCLDASPSIPLRGIQLVLFVKFWHSCLGWHLLAILSCTLVKDRQLMELEHWCPHPRSLEAHTTSILNIDNWVNLHVWRKIKVESIGTDLF